LGSTREFIDGSTGKKSARKEIDYPARGFERFSQPGPRRKFVLASRVDAWVAFTVSGLSISIAASPTSFQAALFA